MPKALIPTLKAESLKAEAARSPALAEALDTAVTKVTDVKTKLTAFKTAYEAEDASMTSIQTSAEALIALLSTL